MNEPFASRVAQLLRQERERPDPAEATRARVLARVQATVTVPSAAPSGGPSEAAPAIGSGSLVRATLLSIAVAAGSMGTLLALRVLSPRVPHVDSATRGAAIALDAARSAAAPSKSTPSIPALGQPSPPHAASIPGPSAPAVADLAAERQLLDRARGEILHGEPAAALVSIGTHARRFPRGVLAEERDALRVEALVSAGRTDDARSAAAKFHTVHPDSVLSAAVDAALEAIP